MALTPSGDDGLVAPAVIFSDGATASGVDWGVGAIRIVPKIILMPADGCYEEDLARPSDSVIGFGDGSCSTVVGQYCLFGVSMRRRSQWLDATRAQ